MNVEIIAATENPVSVISRAAGCCYGKDNESLKRIKTCYDSGHMSVFEHANVTFKITDISRSCSHQLVRHRLASYSQQSQRYCRIDVDDDDWYVTPPDIVPEAAEWYDVQMRAYAKNYKTALSLGMRPEDARYLLPEACKTELFMTMNVRELFHFLDVRCSVRAQWEIHDLAWAMAILLKTQEDWKPLIDLWFDKANWGGDDHE